MVQTILHSKCSIVVVEQYKSQPTNKPTEMAEKREFFDRWQNRWWWLTRTSAACLCVCKGLVVSSCLCDEPVALGCANQSNLLILVVSSTANHPSIAGIATTTIITDTATTTTTTVSQLPAVLFCRIQSNPILQHTYTQSRAHTTRERTRRRTDRISLPSSSSPTLPPPLSRSFQSHFLLEILFW